MLPQQRGKAEAVKWVKDQEGHEHPELSTQEVRQARWGKPVLYVLIGGICGTLVGYGIAVLLAV